MDLIKIGKYIASKRKSLGMTQKQLAEKLGMSDKSVSKWERGVCLPDVSVYKELCSILGISLNEFLAGEDIAQENLIQKSETNIIEVIKDNINKEKCLKVMKYILLVISIFALSLLGFAIYRLKKPQNYISPVAKDSIEMQTAELFAGSDGAFVYKFITTDTYKKLKLHLGHVYDGYVYMKSLGYDEVAKICLTHSFNNHTIDEYIGKFDVTDEELIIIKTELAKTIYDEYDRLIQLCDCLAGAEGVLDIENRMNDVKKRYGFYPQDKWNSNMNLKQYFEGKMNKDIYLICEKDTFAPGDL